MHNIPSHLTTLEEKQNINWYKPMYDYLIDKAISEKDLTKTETCLLAASGIITDETYKYVTNPLSTNNPKLKNFPGTIRNVDFIKHIRDTQMAEYLLMPYITHVIKSNSDLTMMQEDKLKKAVLELAQQKFINLMNEAKAQDESRTDPNQPSAQVPSFEELVSGLSKQMQDEYAIKANDTLEILNEITEFSVRRMIQFFNWWATEEFYTYRYINNGQFVVKSISPLNGFPIKNNSEFVEDYDGFVIKESVSFLELIEVYGGLMKEEDLQYIDKIKEKCGSHPYIIPTELIKSRLSDILRTDEMGVITSNVTNNNFTDKSGNSDIYTIIYKTCRPIKVLQYRSLLDGTINEIEVNMDYAFDASHGDIDITKQWINEVQIGLRIGGRYEGIYIAPKSEEVQRRDSNNKSKVKLPVGGKCGLLTGMSIAPVPYRLMDYLALYKVLTVQMEREIAKYKGNLQLLPKSMITGDGDMNEEEKLFYMKADNTLIFDDTLVDAQVSQQLRMINNDTSSQYIKSIWDIREGIKREAINEASMNDERMGLTKVSQTVGNARENISQAKLGSYLSILMFNEALRRDSEADLEYSKVSWINGISKAHIKPDGEIVNFNLDGIEHFNSEYGVSVQNAPLYQDMLKQIQSLAFNLGQNGDAPLAVNAIKSTDINKISKYIEDYTSATKQYQQQLEADKQNTERLRISEDSKNKQLDRDVIMAREKEITERELTIAEMKLDVDEDISEPTIDNSVNITPIDNNKELLNIRKQEQKEKMDKHKMEMDKKKLNSKLKTN